MRKLSLTLLAAAAFGFIASAGPASASPINAAAAPGIAATAASEGQVEQVHWRRHHHRHWRRHNYGYYPYSYRRYGYNRPYYRSYGYYPQYRHRRSSFYFGFGF